MKRCFIAEADREEFYKMKPSAQVQFHKAKVLIHLATND